MKGLKSSRALSAARTAELTPADDDDREANSHALAEEVLRKRLMLTLKRVAGIEGGGCWFQGTTPAAFRTEHRPLREQRFSCDDHVGRSRSRDLEAVVAVDHAPVRAFTSEARTGHLGGTRGLSSGGSRECVEDHPLGGCRTFESIHDLETLGYFSRFAGWSPTSCLGISARASRRRPVERS